MTTVLKEGQAFPDNHKITLVSDDGSHAYGRPTAGNNAPTDGGPDGGANLGPASTDADAPAGVIPANPIMGSLSQAYNSPAYQEANAGAAVTTGDTLAGPNMGHGATIVVPQSGDRPSGGAQAYNDADPGTVGESVNQGG